MNIQSPCKATLLTALLLIGSVMTSAATHVVWPVIDFIPVVSDAGPVVGIENAADGSGRLFLVRQEGTIAIFKNGELLDTPLLDISDRVIEGGEMGLLGLAFPPDFTNKKCFYIYYTRQWDKAAVLSRITMSEDPDIALLDSEEILLVIEQPDSNHNGGQLAFGPDRFLYIATGDGGSHNDPDRNSQNLTNHLGKILRIDVDNTSDDLPYAIPLDNPFADSETNAPEILCWGLRNPWRFSFDPLTGDMYIGDVGENRREEINHIPFAAINAGTNFGWSVMEGTLDLNEHEDITGALVSPVFEYDHSLGSSVTGGYMYRGENPRLQGLYIFGDFMSGRIWAMKDPAAGGAVETLKESAYMISTFGTDETGEIYFADYFLGRIYRIVTRDTLPPPAINPPSGIYVNKVTFTINTDVPDAVVRYTMDGTEPDNDSPVFTPGVLLEHPHPFTLKAASFRPDMPVSPVAAAVYQLRPWQVDMGGWNNFFNDHVTIHLNTTTPETEIHYTVDGSDPGADSPLYSPDEGVRLERSALIKAVAIKSSAGWVPSLVASRRITLTVAAPSLNDLWPDLHDPVDLSSKTQGASFHYTTDDTLPTIESPIWTGPMQVPSDTRIRILAVKGDMGTSTANLTISRISAQKSRFEKLSPAYLGLVRDVVKTDDDTWYAIGINTIWKISGGLATVYHTGGFAQSYQSITVTPDGRLAVADSSTRRIDLFTPPAIGASSMWGMTPAVPHDLVALPDGGFLVADRAGNRIWKVTASQVVTPYAGSGTAGEADGPVMDAQFRGPVGIERDEAGNVYVLEGTGNRVRKIGTDGIVSTVAGDGTGGWVDGPVATARFAAPSALARDRIGNLYVAEGGGKVRKIRTDGTVTTLRGSIFQTGTSTVHTPDWLGSQFPAGLDVDDDGVLYIAGSDTIMKAVQEDWDNDGIPDAIETELGAPFVVGVDDRFADADGDGFSNCAEWLAGTDPLNPDSHPSGPTFSRLADGTVSLDLPRDPGKIHQLEFSDNLLNWQSVGALVPASPLRSHSARFKVSLLVPQRFYRLVETP